LQKCRRLPPLLENKKV